MKNTDKKATLDISFEGFFQCRLATDPDPSAETRGISGFTLAVAGETLLEPTIWCQQSDIEKQYGRKDVWAREEAPESPLWSPDVDNDSNIDIQNGQNHLVDGSTHVDSNEGFPNKIETPDFNIKNIRIASPDYSFYNEKGIGIYVNGVAIFGGVKDDVKKNINEELFHELNNAKVRFKPAPHKDDKDNHYWPYSLDKKDVTNDKFWEFKGPIFEGRNQITSDGDPDRFAVSPLIFDISDSNNNSYLRRWDPLYTLKPKKQLIEFTIKEYSEMNESEGFMKRWPINRFAQSTNLLNQVGIDNAIDHFTYRFDWLKSKVSQAEAMADTHIKNEAKREEYLALTQSYKSRLYGVDFFTKATGPTVLENRLASRIPLRQLYKHELRGTDKMISTMPIVISDRINKILSKNNLEIDSSIPWDIEYYLGAYDGDLMAGYSTGTLSLPIIEKK